jgi:hypothetical protein
MYKDVIYHATAISVFYNSLCQSKLKTLTAMVVAVG